MKYKLLFVIFLTVSSSVFSLSEYIERYQVHNSTESDIEVNIEFKQTLKFKFNRSDFDLLDQAGFITRNSVRKLVNENIVVIKPDETLSLFSISKTSTTEGISSIAKISQLVSVLDIRDNCGNVILNMNCLTVADILEVPFSKIEFQYIIVIAYLKVKH